jgi:aminopeptidase-like protein
MMALIAELYPICRSITGDGVRQTLRRIQQCIPLTLHEVPSGTPAFDWTVPLEWNIRDAWVKNAAGERVIDFRQHNLHVVSYSVPVHRMMSLDELKPHLHTLPEYPDWIPYRTSYYKEYWGFCLAHNDLLRMQDGEYEVCVDSTLALGSLTYGECYLPGEIEDEVLISCHICHPSLANDNLSGISLAVELASRVMARAHRYSYRFLFIPGTIGSITWLSCNEDKVERIRHGLVLTCVGDAGALTYKKSRRGDADIDRAMICVLSESGKPHRVIDFYPYGYDERQYCSPGFNLPVGCFMRSQHGTFPEYHTSADNLGFVNPEYLEESLEIVDAALQLLEGNRRYVNRNPKCEPQLGKRGLYQGLAGLPNQKQHELALLWVLNQSDGGHSLLDITERSGLPFGAIRRAADTLAQYGLLGDD